MKAVVIAVGLTLLLAVALVPQFKSWEKQVVVEAQKEVTAQKAQEQKKQEPNKLTVTEDKWTTVEVPPMKCMRFWGTDPTGNAFHVQAVRVNTTVAIDWKTYLEDMHAGRIPDNDVGWVKFKSTKGDALVNYVLFPSPCRGK